LIEFQNNLACDKTADMIVNVQSQSGPFVYAVISILDHSVYVTCCDKI